MSGSQKSFKFSSNFSQIISNRKQQTQQFIKEIAQQTKNKQKSSQKQSSHSKQKKPTNHPLFKLNTKSEALIDQVPIQNIKKKSQSRLQSMQDESLANKNKFNLLQNQNQRKQHLIKQKRQIFKKYNIDLNMVMAIQNKSKFNQAKNCNDQVDIQEEEDTTIIKPSQLYVPETKPSDPFSEPCIIQTPLLPCFSSQFLAVNNLATENSCKKIRQGEGVWRIGKMRVKRNNKEGTLKIGDIQFIMQGVGGQGKCVAIQGQSLFKLPNWKGMWVAQPTEQLFNL